MTSPQPNDMIFQHSLRSHLKPKKLAIAVTIGISLLAVTHSSYAFKPSKFKYTLSNLKFGFSKKHKPLIINGS